MCLLIVTNSDDSTVDFVQDKLPALNTCYQRLNTDLLFTDFTQTVHISNEESGDQMLIESAELLYNLSDVTGVWYRRPVEPNLHPTLGSDQARKFAADEGYYFVRCLWKMLENRKWVSKPSAISWANAKLDQLKVARSLGFRIPRSLATTDPDKAMAFYHACNEKVVVKPFTTATLDYGDQLVSILTNRVTKESLAQIAQVRSAITFFQEEITKLFEIRVTVIGDDVYSAKIDSQSDERRSLDWRSTSPLDAQWIAYKAPTRLEDACRKMVAHYGLNFGTFDFAYTPEGEYVFFELNPNGQWAWLEIQIGYPMTRSLVKALGQ